MICTHCGGHEGHPDPEYRCDCYEKQAGEWATGLTADELDDAAWLAARKATLALAGKP